MNWTAVAPDHWIAIDSKGRPLSLKKWPLGWVLIQKHIRHRPSTLFNTLSSAVLHLTSKRRRH